MAADTIRLNNQQLRRLWRRLIIVLLTLAATVAGIAPALLFLDHPEWLWLFAGEAVVLAFVCVFFMWTSYATNAPRPWEFLLGWLGAVCPPALLGLLWLVVYAILFVVWGGIQPPPAALVVTLALAMFFGLFVILLSFVNLADQLYPNSAGIQSAFYGLLRQKGWQRVWGIAGVAMVGAVAATSMLPDVLFHRALVLLLIAIALFFVSAPWWLMSAQVSRIGRDDNAVQTVEKLFQKAGYEFERDPRTGKADVDPLLTDLDMLARKGIENHLVRVESEHSTGQLVNWTAAAKLNMAATLLMQERCLAAENVDFRLILFDVEADESLAAPDIANDVRVVRLTADRVAQVLDGRMGDKEQQEEAMQLLDLGSAPD